RLQSHGVFFSLAEYGIRARNVTGDQTCALSIYEITQKALVCGGDTLTATDVVVAFNKADIGDPSLLSHLDQTLLEAIYTDMMYKVEVAIDRMKTSADDVPVILVGGGSILVSHTLEGASEVIQTNNHEVANAIG